MSGNAEIQKVEFKTRLNTNPPGKGRKKGGLNRKEMAAMLESHAITFSS